MYRVALALFAASASTDLATETRDMMGTRVTVSIDGSPEKARAGFAAAFQVFEHIDAVMNEWRPESALSRINDHAGSARGTEAPADLCDLIQASLDGARRTHGFFDPSWAALRDLWRFGSDQTGQIPEPEAVKARCPLVSWKNVEVLPGTNGCSVKLAKPGMKLGLGGVAKGWGVDRAVQALRKLGLSNFYVQAGGDLYAAGKKEGRAWRVGIRDPRQDVDSTFAILEISDAAFSTSGDYEHFFIESGRRYHHIIDPRTCYPATASRSVTILAKTGTDAEFLTKAVFIQGGEAGIAMADAWGASAVIVTAENKVLFSKALEGRLHWWQPHAQ